MNWTTTIWHQPMGFATVIEATTRTKIVYKTLQQMEDVTHQDSQSFKSAGKGSQKGKDNKKAQSEGASHLTHENIIMMATCTYCRQKDTTKTYYWNSVYVSTVEILTSS